MIPHKKTFGAIIILSAILIMFLSSCEGTKEKLEEKKDKVIEKTDNLINEAEKKADEVVDKLDKKADQMLSYATLKGTWSGTLDSRKTTLVITEQSDNTIKGKITINYRTPINQEVAGTYDPTTNKLIMEDQLHSRYKGKYDGRISEDGKTYSGTFTTLVDKNSYKFSLTKN